MYKLNVKAMQQVANSKDGKRNRLPQTAFEDSSANGRIAVLHPTKGWRSRNMAIVLRHGEVIRALDERRQKKSA